MSERSREMLAIALRGLPRDSYRLMTKMRVRGDEDPKAAIDRFRRELESARSTP